MFDQNKFKYFVIKNGTNLEKTAKAINVTYSTLRRKMTGESDFTREEVQTLRDYLQMSPSDVEEVFLLINLRKRKTEKGVS